MTQSEPSETKSLLKIWDGYVKENNVNKIREKNKIEIQ